MAVASKGQGRQKYTPACRGSFAQLKKLRFYIAMAESANHFASDP
jgi:hypothetical protein